MSSGSSMMRSMFGTLCDAQRYRRFMTRSGVDGDARGARIKRASWRSNAGKHLEDIEYIRTTAEILLIPYTSTDAFGLYCLAEHGGDYRAAVGAAAFELGLPSLEVEAAGEEQVQALIASVGGGAVAVTTPKPGELISFPSYSLPDEADPGAGGHRTTAGGIAGAALAG